MLRGLLLPGPTGAGPYPRSTSLLCMCLSRSDKSLSCRAGPPFEPLCAGLLGPTHPSPCTLPVACSPSPKHAAYHTIGRVSMHALFHVGLSSSHTGVPLVPTACPHVHHLPGACKLFDSAACNTYHQPPRDVLPFRLFLRSGSVTPLLCRFPLPQPSTLPVAVFGWGASQGPTLQPPPAIRQCLPYPPQTPPARPGEEGSRTP